MSTADPSVTDIGEPALVRASSIEIARGTVLAGRYQIEAVIGKGGSGIVLRAFDRVAQVPVAIKILKPDLATDPRWIERFSRELRLARQIQHPNVCRVFDIGQADGHWFITMELATGGTLRDQLGEHATARAHEEKLTDIRAVVAGLAAIHGAGIVHRDLKPDNFLRMEDGRLVLSDFGLATNPADAPVVSIMVGTPHYMAPEVVMGEAATQRSDVWSAGVVIHEILFGARPDRRVTARGLGARPSSTVTGQNLRQFARWLPCLADDPEDRPATGADLERILEGGRGTSTRGARRRARSRLVWGAVTAATIVAAALSSRRLWRPAAASSPAQLVVAIASEGTARDWSAGSKLVAHIDERVHCFAVLPGGETARVVRGTPRRAEDIDVATGHRTPSRLAPETFAVDCPQLSPNGKALVYTRAPEGASPEIVRAEPDGGHPMAVTTGTEPRWLPTGDEFVFEMADSHVAVFSLPTMKYNLLADDRGQKKEFVYKKAVSDQGDLVAVAFQGEGANRLLELHSIPDLRVVGKWEVPNAVRDLDFIAGDLFVSNSADGGTLDRLDWRTGASRRTGRVPNRLIRSVVPLPDGDRLVVSTTHDSDAWLFNPGRPPRQLTHDGRSYWAAWSPKGGVLLVRQLDDGRVAIFSCGDDGKLTQLTRGPFDLSPTFAGTGSTWIYNDFARKAIVRCDGANACSDVMKGEKLLQWPTMSPDERHIAFVTPFGVPRINISNASGGEIRDLGSTALECPPAWTSPTSLWAFSGAGNQRRWEEIDVASARRTGRTKNATTFDPDRQTCGWEADAPSSPFFQRARIVTSESWEAIRSRKLPGLD